MRLNMDLYARLWNHGMIVWFVGSSIGTQSYIESVRLRSNSTTEDKSFPALSFPKLIGFLPFVIGVQSCLTFVEALTKQNISPWDPSNEDTVSGAAGHNFSIVHPQLDSL